MSPQAGTIDDVDAHVSPYPVAGGEGNDQQGGNILTCQYLSVRFRLGGQLVEMIDDNRDIIEYLFTPPPDMIGIHVLQCIYFRLNAGFCRLVYTTLRVLFFIVLENIGSIPIKLFKNLFQRVGNHLVGIRVFKKFG